MDTPLWGNCQPKAAPPRMYDYCRWLAIVPGLLTVPITVYASKMKFVFHGTRESTAHTVSLRILGYVQLACVFHLYGTIAYRTQGYLCADTVVIAACSYPLLLVIFMWTVWSQTTLKRHRNKSRLHLYAYTMVTVLTLTGVATLVMRLHRFIQSNGVPHVFERLYLNAEWNEDSDGAI